MSVPTRSILCTLTGGSNESGEIIWPTGVLYSDARIMVSVSGDATDPAIGIGGLSGIYIENSADISFSWNGTKRASIKDGGLTLSAGFSTPISTKTDNYTATPQDHTLLFNIATAKTLALPAAASNSGRIYFLKSTDSSADTLTVNPNGAELIDGASTYSIAPSNAAIIQCDGTGWHVVSYYAI